MAAYPVDTVDDGSARSVQGPTVGYCDATVTTAEEGVDLSLYGGRYVTIYFEDASGNVASGYVCFHTAASNAIVLTAQAMGTAGVPMRVDRPEHFVVPKAAPFLRYRGVSAAATLIRVVPS